MIDDNNSNDLPYERNENDAENQNIQQDSVEETQLNNEETSGTESGSVGSEPDVNYVTSRYQVTPEMQEFKDKIRQVREECSKLVVGQDETIELMMTCILAGGHVLLEGVPGIAKTLSAKVLARSIHADFARKNQFNMAKEII